MNYDNLSNAELEELVTRNLNYAKKNGYFKKCVKIVTKLGEHIPNNCTSLWYEFKTNTLTINLERTKTADDLITIYTNTKKIAELGDPKIAFFIPGPHEEEINTLYKQTLEQEQTSFRQSLLRKLGAA